MASRQLCTLIQHLRRSVCPRGEETLGDAQLLERWSQRHDEAAFEVLLWRHGPMVLSVCRRLLRESHDIEDAFQAAFLTLVRRGASIRHPEALAAWLYRVAFRIALRLRRQADARTRHEQSGIEALPCNRADELSERELYAVLDEEIDALPERYRQAFVLCCREGKTHEETARLLGRPLGTISCWIKRGRERLHGRLVRRGFAPAAALAALVEGEAHAALPAALVQSTCRGATAFVAGRASAAAMISARVIALVEAAVQGTFVTKWQWMLVLVLTLGLTAAGASMWAYQPIAPPDEKSQAPEQPRKQEGQAVRTDRHGDPLPPGALVRLGSTRFRHGGGFGSVAYAPDGKLIASGGKGEDVIHLWDPGTGREIRRIAGYASFLAFSPDGKILATANRDNTIVLWDMAKGERLRTIASGPVFSVAFAHDGKTLAAGSWQKNVRLWDVATGQCRRDFTGHKGQVFSVSFSADDSLLASGGIEDKRICLWDAKTGTLVRELGARQEGITLVRFSPGGKTLAAGGDNGAIHLWEVRSGKLVRRFTGHSNRVTGLVFTADGKTLISAGDDATVRVWDVAGGKQVRLLGQHGDQIYGLALSPDEKTVVSAGLDNVVRRWDLAGGKALDVPAGHEHRITSVWFAPKGNAVISDAKDGGRRIWEVKTGKELQQDNAVRSLASAAALSTDGRTVAVADKGTVQLRDRATGKQRSLPAVSADLHTLLFAPNGKVLAGATIAPAVHLWDTDTGQELCRVPEHGWMHNNMVFSPDGRLFATGGSVFVPGGNVLRLWDTRAGKQVQRIAGRHKALLALCFSADGRMLASWSGDPTGQDKQEHELIVWETATGGERIRFRGHRWQINAAAFSADGRLLAAGEWQQMVRVWDMLTGQERQKFNGEQGAIGAMSFSSDGTQLACGGENTTILIWPVARPVGQVRPSQELSVKSLESRWSDLGGTDAARAYQAMKDLFAAPEQTVALLRGRLRPVAAVDAARVERSIADLDAADFKIREQATKELEQLGEAVAPFLRQVLRRKPSLELRRRGELLLEKLTADSLERLRTLRALEVLEGLNTADSRELLEHLASGVPNTWLTREAKASLDRRTARRPAVKR